MKYHQRFLKKHCTRDWICVKIVLMGSRPHERKLDKMDITVELDTAVESNKLDKWIKSVERFYSVKAVQTGTANGWPVLRYTGNE